MKKRCQELMIKWSKEDKEQYLYKEAIYKSLILLLQYWENYRYDSTWIIFYLWWTNIIFADCIDNLPHNKQEEKLSIGVLIQII